MKMKKLLTIISITALSAAGPGSAIADIWHYEGESWHGGLTYSDRGSDTTARGFEIGFGNLTQSLGGWIWDATANYSNVDSPLESEWGVSLSGDLGYRFPNVIRGLDVDLIGGLSSMDEFLEVRGSSEALEYTKLETTWAKAGIGFFGQATPTTDIRFEMGIKEALEADLGGHSGRVPSRELERLQEEDELRTLYAGVEVRFLNRSRFPVVVSLNASHSAPHGASNNSLTLAVGFEF